MNTELVKNFREKIGNGPVLGPFMKTADPAFVEAAGYAGMDFVILDMEHGPVNLTAMQNNIRAAQLAKTLPVIRVGELSEFAILQALDVGAAGVQVPQIRNAEEARDVVRFSKYYPIGERGVCRFVRAARYSATPRQEYFANANNDALLIIHLEGREALENLDEILAVEGIDIVFIGPYDLSQSLGVPGETGHPKVIAAMEDVVSRAKKAGVTVGTFTDSAETLNTWKSAGVRYLSYSVDVGIFYEACAKLVSSIKE